MRRCVAAPIIWLVALALAAACAPAAVEPTFTPMVLPSPTVTSVSSPLPTVTQTVVPTPTKTATPAPTLNPDIVATAAASGQSGIAAHGVEPLCLRWEDTDGDGAREWLGVYLHEGAVPELRAFIMDGDAWYELKPLEHEKYGLGRYPICEIDVRDINTDGIVEILIWGHARESVGLLHIYAWDGSDYRLVAPFEGSAGVRVENRDGDLADEIVLRYIHRAGRVWEAVYTWDGQNYGWTWERYAWHFLDRPHAYSTGNPEDAVISYYLALGDRDMPEAYRLLSASTQAALPYEVWVAGFGSVLDVEVGAVGELSASEESAAVACQVRTYESLDGRAFIVLRDVQWTLVHAPDGWRLESETAVELDRWEVVYYQ